MKVNLMLISGAIVIATYSGFKKAVIEKYGCSMLIVNGWVLNENNLS